jgi:hypothetical protein
MAGSISTHLLEIHQSYRSGFQPLVDSSTWRVGLLSYAPDFVADRIVEFQRHNDSDELFVLLAGECILFLGEGEDAVTRILAQKMEPFKFYNIKQRAWHGHVLSPDARIIIVENRDTSRANSPRLILTPEQRAEVIEQSRQMLDTHGTN